MRFVANGPDIPEALLQAHEEGGVVFFAGRGFPRWLKGASIGWSMRFIVYAAQPLAALRKKHIPISSSMPH